VLRAELGRETGAARPDPRFPYAWRRLLTGEPGELAERQRALGSRWLDTLAEIRALDGFEEFPAEPLTDRPHPGVAGEVVLLAVSDHGGYALIVRPESVDVLPLPLLTSHSARRQADVLRTALDALEDPELPLAEQARREGDIGACLAWLRTTVTTPVLERCGERVWWIPAGPLAALPIHAAALDEVCSSYSPTLAALRGSASSGEADALLLVAMPETPGAPPLPGVVAEIDLLRSLSPVELIGQDATKAVVTAALAECEIAHFACHSAPATDHAPARLLLHDHQTEPLTLLDIAHISVPSGRLAYLSSCATSLGSAQLADEATHLAAAFGLAGFPQVVATLWPVDDQTALDVTTSCYSLMRTERGVDPTGAAEALHSSTLELAARNPGNPSLWACHIHVGR
jgi:hypothetical protein